jgi:hypothetical protein
MNTVKKRERNCKSGRIRNREHYVTGSEYFLSIGMSVSSKTSDNMGQRCKIPSCQYSKL